MSVELAEFAQKLILDGTKVGWWKERVEAWKRGEKIAPVTIDCAMTRQCQASCHFCYAQIQANDNTKITQKNFFDFLDDAAEIGVKGVSFISDGESTMVPWYADAVEHASKLGLKVGAGSNGIKLTKPVLERVLPHLSYLRFNFSAGEQKRYAEIMGVRQAMYDVVVQNIRDGMEIIRRDNLSVSLNMQMVCDPRDADQILPFARLVAELKPVYGIIKHCSDDSEGTLGVDYTKYAALTETFQEAERIGQEAGVRLAVKWQKIANEGKRLYKKCLGPPFIMQISGSGLVSSCGFNFNTKYRKFHAGSICTERFKDIWASDRYWEIMRYLASDEFDPSKKCGALCLQDRVNQWLYEYVNGRVDFPEGEPPPDLEFI